ncbi:MAG: hypothetical protein V2A79_18700 [Planctomycetota bacterium]
MDRSAMQQAPAPSAPPAPFGIPPGSTVWPVLLALVVALAGDANTLVNDFAYDDLPIIVGNPAVTDPGRTADIWTRDYWAHVRGYDPQRDLLYRPLTVLSFRLNHAIGGLEPFGYHLVNLALHALVAALVVVVAVRVSCSWAGGAAAGVLFAVMPIHTEAVANVVGRAELLAALFTLLAVVVALRGEPSPASDAAGCLTAPVLWGAVLAAAALGALLSKESGVVVLGLAPLFAAVGGTGPARLRRFAAAAAAVMVALAVYLPLRYHALDGRLVQTAVPSPITNLLVDATAAERFWGAWQLFGLYIAKTFWPWTLCVDYSYKAMGLADSPANLHVLIGIGSLSLLLAGAVLWWRRDRRRLAAVCVAVLLAYLPVSNTLFLIKTLFAERLWYLPSAFLVVVCAAAATEQRGRFPSGNRRGTVPFFAMVLVGVAVVAGMLRTWQRNADWRDNGTLFASAYRVHPTSAPVLYAYGQWTADAGDPRGIELLERCVRMAPGLFDAQLALGKAYLRRGDDDMALAPLRAAAMQQSGHPEARRLLEQVAARVSARRQADLDRLREQSEQSPSDLEALCAWSAVLSDVGKVDQALAVLAKAAPRFVDRAAYHRAYATALMLAGQRDRAIDAYRTCVALDASSPNPLVELATALMDRHRSGDAPEAEQLIDHAFRLAPHHPQVLIARAEWLAFQGRREEAVKTYRGLLERLPPGELRSTLETRLETLERK